MLSETSTARLINISILTGAFLLVASFLVAFIFLARNSWTSGLRENVIETVEEYEKGEWKIGEKIDFKSSLSTSSAVYKCTKVKNDGNEYFAVIIRITSIAGPLPAVFICKKNDSRFIGYALQNGKLSNILTEQFSPSHIKFWQNKLPEILLQAGVIDD